MPFLFEYLLKLSVSLGLVYLFYQLVLRKLTFYNWNRWYLVIYTLLCFILAFVDITPSLQKNELLDNEVLRFIPSIEINQAAEQASTQQLAATTNSWNEWNWLFLILLTGVSLLLIRLCILYFSFRKVRRQAVLLSGGTMKLYHVEKDIIPFSFGNSIFINRDLHNEAELQEIIRHEFVHVKQKHTQDIIWSELLCMLNWYNPFAWLIRKAIRQNLEFIADNKVLENGFDKKQYQYLLLKVIGNNYFSIANQFNFSSLKKRIAMMNKMKSARRHLFKFLFILPLVAVMLLAFRDKINPPAVSTKSLENPVAVSGLVVDAGTREPVPFATISFKQKNISVQADEKGYFLIKLPNEEDKEFQFDLLITANGYEEWHQHEHWANLYHKEMHDIFGNTFEFFGLQKKGNKEEGFSFIGGSAKSIEGLKYENALAHFNRVKNNPPDQLYIIDTPPPPPPPVPRTPPPPPVPPPPAVPKLPGNIISINVNNHNATVDLKDGTKEKYNLNVPAEKETFEKKYGKMVPPPPPPPVPSESIPPTPPREVKEVSLDILAPVPVTATTTVGPAIVKNTNVNAAVSSTLTYNTDIRPVTATNIDHLVVTTAKPITTTVAPVAVKSALTYNSDIRPVAATSIDHLVVATAKPVTTTLTDVAPVATTLTGASKTFSSDEKIMEFKIYKSTSREKLDRFIAEAKSNGVELVFDKIEYNNKNELTHISGVMTKEKSKSTFSISSFESVTLFVVKNGNGYSCGVYTNDQKEEM